MYTSDCGAVCALAQFGAHFDLHFFPEVPEQVAQLRGVARVHVLAPQPGGVCVLPITADVGLLAPGAIFLQIRDAYFGAAVAWSALAHCMRSRRETHPFQLGASR